VDIDTASPDQLTAAKTSLSVKEAVQIAKDNNFMGLICSFELMVSCFLHTPMLNTLAVSKQISIGIYSSLMALFLSFVCLFRRSRIVANFDQNLAPRLIETIKTAGLVLISDISKANPGSADIKLFVGRDADKGIDGTVQANGVLHFNESVDL
jgi:CDK inhibitor PHO81